MCLNFSGAPSQSDTGGQSPRKLNRSVYCVSPVLSQSWSIQRIAGAIILVPWWCDRLGYYGVLSGIGLKQCIRSESAGVRLLCLKVALQFSSASVFAIEEEISYFCLSIFPCSNFIVCQDSRSRFLASPHSSWEPSDSWFGANSVAWDVSLFTGVSVWDSCCRSSHFHSLNSGTSAGNSSNLQLIQASRWRSKIKNSPTISPTIHKKQN